MSMQTHELLFEIGTEEIPAGYIVPAVADMKKILTHELTERELSFGTIQTAATPRRLTVCVKDLADRQPDSREEVFGPPRQAAFDADNKPTKACEGFARSKGVSLDDIHVVNTGKGEYVMVVVEKKGMPTTELLPDILERTIQLIHFPKSMRWGSGQKSFARPIQWLLTRYGDDIVPCTINNVSSADFTCGHRFMAPDPIRIDNFKTYITKLKTAHVIADLQERKETVLTAVKQAAGNAGGRILDDEKLLDTVTNLVESPYAVCGTFDDKFLELPREVLITSMREHQKYFAVVDDKGNLLPHFIAVNNTHTKNEKLATEGHERVIRARLEDALFFFNEDKHKKLADRINDLKGVIFQYELGTMQEKTARITALAGWLAKRLAPEKTDAAKQTARLAKTDLLTEMVNEFPSLQGVMGRDYALLDGEKMEVAQAIAEHYQPVRAGSTLPASTTGAIVGLADRLDTICGCFGIGKQPTGTTDPFGLRRLALGLLHIIEDKGFTLSLAEAVYKATELYGDRLTEKRDRSTAGVLEFIKGRFVNDRSGSGMQQSAVEAVVSVSFDDVNDAISKIKSLESVKNEPTFDTLAGSFKRVRNIIKDHSDSSVDPALLGEEAEKNLFDSFEQIKKEIEPPLAAGDYKSAMTGILKMKEPVDRFFEEVMVMVDDEKIKQNRLCLLTAISQLFLRIGDFSKMQA